MTFIIDLMVISNVYFVKLRDFIILRFLFGFSVKIGESWGRGSRRVSGSFWRVT